MLLALLAAGGSAHAARRVALVIGNSDYRHESKLGNPVNDARLIAATLRRLDFVVIEQQNLAKREMSLAITRFVRESAGADTALLYFAGHGMQPLNGGINYLLPVDANITDDDALEADALRADRIVEQLERQANPARLRLVVLDACRNNRQSGRSRGDVRGLARMAPSDDYTLIAFSTNDRDVALDGSGSYSPYAEALNRHLGRAAELPMRRVFELTATDVRQATGQKQRPRTYGDLDSRVGLDGLMLAAPAQVAVGPKPGDVIKDCAVCPEVVVIPAGSFVMGSPATEANRDSDEGPQRQARIASVAVGRFEVTFEEWDACVAEKGCSHRPDDRGWGRGRRPVMNVSWNDAQDYVKWLSGKTGKGYRLLSEAEWEYAARGGTQTAYAWGTEVGRGMANCDGCGSQWDNRQTAPVGSFKPNGFGLYDMHGNVWEWVQDVWHDSYAGAPSEGRAWMEGGDQVRQVLRGGSWSDLPRNLRSAIRYGSTPDNRNVSTGVRIARTL